MSTQTERVDVLAVMDYLARRYVANRGTEHQFISCITPNCHGNNEALRKSEIGTAWLDLIESRVIVDELVDAARCVSSHKPRSSAQINADWNRLRAALARIGEVK